MQLSLIYNFKLTINSQCSITTFSTLWDRIISLASKHNVARTFHCFSQVPGIPVLLITVSFSYSK